jgi:outer membrane protein
MKQVQSYIALLCVLLVACPGLYAQNLNDRTPRLDSPGAHWYSRFTEPYEPKNSPPINVSNSNRVDSLIRGGMMYLSLNDAIALALENNIDVEVQRYNYLAADSQYRSSLAGPGGAFDPVFTATPFNWGHTSNPATNLQTNGGVSINVNDSRTHNFAVQQTFLTGANLSLGFNNSSSIPNSLTTNFLPSFNSSLQLQATQPLLNGFGLAYNNRNIRIAKNNIKVTDYQFQLNLNTTLDNVIQQYWNLVGDRMAVVVAQSTLDLNQTQVDNNKKQVEIGTMAPIDELTSESGLESARTSLIRSQGAVLQQELVLKNLLSRNGIASASFADIHIVPTDSITVPDVEPVQPIQDLIATALDHRPEVSQQRLQLENSNINLSAAKNQLLPSFGLTGQISNPTSGGLLNPNFINPSCKSTDPNFATQCVNADLIGGYSNITRNVFGTPNLNYSFGFTVTIPLKNRANQEAYIQQDLALKQSDLGLQKQINQIRVDVNNAEIAIDNAHAQYDSATKSRKIFQQVYDAEVQKLGLGASTPYLVTQHLNDLTNAKLTELQAQTNYAQVKLQLDLALGMILDHYNIQIDEAKNGRVSRSPDPIPVVPPNGAAYNQRGEPLNSGAKTLR